MRLRPILLLSASFGSVVLVACGSTVASSSPPPAGVVSTVPGDAGSVDANAAENDARPDASADASSDVDADATCGGAICRDGQRCVGGACVEPPCTGAHVPGTYATIAAAIDALNGAGGGTICLGAGTYAEDVATTGSRITVVGVSSARTTVNSITLETWGDFALRGIHVTHFVKVTQHEGTFRVDDTIVDRGTSFAAPLPPAFANAAGLEAHASAFFADGGLPALYVERRGPYTMLVDGCEIAASGYPALDVYLYEEGSAGAGTFTLTNSYVHDSAQGIHVTDNGDIFDLADTFTLENDVFRGNAVAVTPATSKSRSGFVLRYFNDVFVQNQLGLDLPFSIDVEHGHNALYGNVTDYAGSAVDGSGYLHGDPQLDTSTPPRPLASSPLRGAGDAAHAPDHDYWGRARGASVDIGAVQTP